MCLNHAPDMGILAHTKSMFRHLKRLRKDIAGLKVFVKIVIFWSVLKYGIWEADVFGKTFIIVLIITE